MEHHRLLLSLCNKCFSQHLVSSVNLFHIHNLSECSVANQHLWLHWNMLSCNVCHTNRNNHWCCEQCEVSSDRGMLLKWWTAHWTFVSQILISQLILYVNGKKIDFYIFILQTTTFNLYYFTNYCFLKFFLNFWSPSIILLFLLYWSVNIHHYIYLCVALNIQIFNQFNLV